jgi:biotin transport system substrate-specific component
MSGETAVSAPENLRRTVAAAGFTALIAIGAYISIPIGPVPIVLQNFFVLLAGVMLPGRTAAAAVGVYLFLGAVGLPVFSGGTGGFAHFIGPTGGYLIAYLPAAYLVAAASSPRSRSLPRDLLALSAGVLLIFALGVPWLKYSTGMSWKAAAGAGLLPFLPGDALKVAAAAFVSRAFKPRLLSILNHDE